MVAYRISLRRARRSGWEDAYLDYQSLASILEEIERLYEQDEIGCVAFPPGVVDEQEYVYSLQQTFMTRLRKEIEKASLFTLTQQGRIADAVGSLRFEGSVPEISPPSVTIMLENASEQNGENGYGHIVVADSEDSFDEEAALLPRGSIVSALKTPKPRTKTLSTEDSSPSRPMFCSDAIGLDESRVDTTDAYAILGVELLHLLRFICVNAMGFRKILKKHDKILSIGRRRRNQDLDVQDDMDRHLVCGPEDHLQQLVNSDAVDAIYSSLVAELEELEANQMGGMDVYQMIPEGSSRKEFLVGSYPISLIRFMCVVSSIHTLREYVKKVNKPFSVFLSHKAMIVTGQDLGDLERNTQKALALVLRFQPDSLLAMDEVALRSWRTSVHSKDGSRQTHDYSPTLQVVEGREDSWGGVSSTSFVINLLSTMLYTVNYYIAAPTANHYAISLGSDGAFGATLIGASSLAAIFAAFLYSFWYVKSSFRSALLFSAVAACLGNLLYGLAISYKSMQVAFWGRILVGFGSAEVVNRQLIAACMSFQHMTQSSALFVAASAIGMSVGPLLAAILDMTAGRDFDVDLELPLMPSGGIIFNHVTSPGFVMACLWFMEILMLIFLFREPDRINGSEANVPQRSFLSFESTEHLEDCAQDIKKGTTRTEYGTGALPTIKDVSSSTVGAVKELWSQMVSVKRLIFENMALPVTLLLFGYIELADEVLISSCSMVCRRYFGWHGSRAGLLIASLGALVLPAHFIVERYSRRYKERAIMKYSIVFICVGLLAILNYEGLIFDIMGVAAESVGVLENNNNTQGAVESDSSVDVALGGNSISSFLNDEHEVPYDWGLGTGVYVTFLSAIFLGTIILEGVDTSLMAKVTPAKLNETFMNSGLLATLVGTMGRVFGDSMITISALVDKNIFSDFVNATFFPMIPIALIGYLLVLRYYTLLL